MGEDRKCFIMLCLKTTQQECIDRKLFAEVERTFDLIRRLKPGDIGFLFNLDTNTLIGPFEAASEPGLNLEPEAWKGKYPAQIRVKLHTRHLKEISNANKVLEAIGIACDERRMGVYQPRLPVHDSVKMNALKSHILNNGSPLSETNADQFVKTENEVIELYKSELPDGYLEVLNDVAKETEQKIIEELSIKPPMERKLEQYKPDIPKPFNICVLGEVTNETQIAKALGEYFLKNGVSARDWNITFYSNNRIKQGILPALKKGQSNFNLIVIGQIHNHKLPGAKTQTIETELSNGKYMDYRRGSDPKQLLSSDKAIETVDKYIVETFRR